VAADLADDPHDKDTSARMRFPVTSTRSEISATDTPRLKPTICKLALELAHASGAPRFDRAVAMLCGGDGSGHWAGRSWVCFHLERIVERRVNNVKEKYAARLRGAPTRERLC
jgi:hypothetical protein